MKELMYFHHRAQIPACRSHNTDPEMEICPWSEIEITTRPVRIIATYIHVCIL